MKNQSTRYYKAASSIWGNMLCALLCEKRSRRVHLMV